MATREKCDKISLRNGRYAKWTQHICSIFNTGLREQTLMPFVTSTEWVKLKYIIGLTDCLCPTCVAATDLYARVPNLNAFIAQNSRRDIQTSITFFVESERICRSLEPSALNKEKVIIY